VTNGRTSIVEFQFRPGRLELATDLGVTNLRDPFFQKTRYSHPDTMVADTNARKSSVSPPVLSFDTTVVDTSTVIIKQRSALIAVLLSAAIPGGGQIYNRSYWKVPIIYGLQAFFVSQWLSNNKLYRSFRAQFEDSLKTPGSSSQYLAELQGGRDFYHDQRDSYAWYTAGIYVLSVLDAYIDAELSGFDVSPSLGFAPDGSPVAAVSVRVKF